MPTLVTQNISHKKFKYGVFCRCTLQFLQKIQCFALNVMHDRIAKKVKLQLAPRYQCHSLSVNCYHKTKKYITFPCNFLKIFFILASIMADLLNFEESSCQYAHTFFRILTSCKPNCKPVHSRGSGWFTVLCCSRKLSFQKTKQHLFTTCINTENTPYCSSGWYYILSKLVCIQNIYLCCNWYNICLLHILPFQLPGQL